MLLRETRGGLLPPSYLLHARYSIVSQVGTGGFGAVYQARETLFSHRLVAIKEMSQDGLTGKHIFTYTGHSISVALEVQAVAWSPNGRYIASGGMEGTVQVWNAR